MWICRTFGHQFRARYDEKQSHKPFMDNCVLHAETLAAIDASVDKTYRGDVCIRCGRLALEADDGR